MRKPKIAVDTALLDTGAIGLVVAEEKVHQGLH
jgi:hypothetical protein